MLTCVSGVSDSGAVMVCLCLGALDAPIPNDARLGVTTRKISIAPHAHGYKNMEVGSVCPSEPFLEAMKGEGKGEGNVCST